MDLRQYLAKLAELGQLTSIDGEVDWNLRASALAAMSNRIGGPAIHFKNVKDYPGMSLVSGIYTGPAHVHLKREKPWCRQAVAAGLELGTPWERLVGRFMEAQMQRIPPVTTTSGPCKEKVLLGREAQITRLPIPFLHQGDGGRYGTLSALTVKDPETGWQYWGYHRWMVVSPHELTGPFEPVIGPFLAFPPYHVNVIAQKYHARGEAMPFCIVLGGDPALFLASCMFALFGSDQPQVAGGLRREPMEMVKAETSDILVPGNAEVVIEGEVKPGVRADEGPFPEMVTRLPKTPRPVFSISAITHRENPIIPFSTEGGKFSDMLGIRSTFVSLALWGWVKGPGAEALYPIKWINCPPEAMMATCLVSIDRSIPFPGTPAAVARALFTSPMASWFDKIHISEETLKPGDWLAIIDELNQQVHPRDGFHRLKMMPPVYLGHYRNDDAREEPIPTRLYIDATRPLWWDPGWVSHRMTFENTYPPEVRQKVMARWKEYGLPGEPYEE